MLLVYIKACTNIDDVAYIGNWSNPFRNNKINTKVWVITAGKMLLYFVVNNPKTNPIQQYIRNTAIENPNIVVFSASQC
jgi:hypothetical protein